MNRLRKATASILFVYMVLTLFIQSMPQKVFADDNTAIIGYELKMVKKEYKDKNGIVRGIVSFGYPKFIGTSAAIKKINKEIKKARENYFRSDNAKTIKECTKDSIKHNRFEYDTDQYFWTSSCGITYGKGNIVSFCVTEDWYAGGVHNRHDYGFNYDLNTGKKLTIHDVIDGDAKETIIKAAKKYCKNDTTALNIIKNTKDYNFYFEPGKVYICYGSYELHHGTSIDIFDVKGKY